MTRPNGIYVHYNTPSGQKYYSHIDSQVLLDSENSRAEEHKQQLINASKEYLAHLYGEGGTYEVEEVPEEPARHKVRLEVKKGVFLTFDTADIEDIHVSSHRGYDSAPDDTGKFMERKLNGQNTLYLTIEFKHGKHETWDQT